MDASIFLNGIIILTGACFAQILLIARQNIIGNGYKRPTLKLFQGAYGATYFKLYQPFIPTKDELKNRIGK